MSDGAASHRRAGAGTPTQRESDWLEVKSEAVRVLRVSLDAAGVEMPVPIDRQVRGDQALGEEENLLENDGR